MKKFRKLIAILTSFCMYFVLSSTAFAASTDQFNAAESKDIDITVYSPEDDNFAMPLSTDSFTLGSSGGTVTFFDSAYIAVKSSGLSTIKVQLSGNSNTEYQVWFRNTNTFKYIKANGSSCSKYTLTGGTIYIQIDPYNGTNGWVTAKITT